jgi:hypothetical protein
MSTSKIKTYNFSDLKDNQGRYRTQSLFWEYAFLNRDRETILDPIFTIKDYDLTKDGIIYPSLKRIYLSYDHVPGFEYEFAMDMFNSWDHWVKLSQDGNRAITSEISTWKDELDIKIKAKAMKAVMNASLTDDAKGFNAAKYLADKGYAPQRGRPSKEELARHKKQEAGVIKELEADMERLGLTVVNGGK